MFTSSHLAVLLVVGWSYEAMCASFLCTGNTAVSLENVKTVECLTELSKEVCLICNVNASTKDVTWYGNDELLARERYKLDQNHPGGVSLDDCVLEKYSLTIKQLTYENYDILYYCQHGGRNISYFVLKIKAHLDLFAETKDLSDGILAIHDGDTNRVLECVVRNAIPPFTMVWYLNDIEEKRRIFNSSTEFFLSYTDAFSFHLLENQDRLSCAIEGKYISRNKTEMQVFVFPGEERSKANGPYSFQLSNVIWAPIALAIVFLLSLSACVKIQGNYRNQRVTQSRITSTRNVISNNENENQTSFNETFVECEDSVEVVGIIQAKGNNAFFNSSLVKKKGESGPFEYWYGTYSSEKSTERKCFVKILSGKATSEEASSFKLLADTLKTFSTPYTVDVLSCNIEKEPFGIYYEFLQIGSLRDYVIKTYNNTVMENDEQFVKKLLQYALNIADAMIYLSSKKFCHPILSLKKVFLNVGGCCKLYDVYPCNMAMMKVNITMKKVYPPIAWMSPETIFHYLHHPDSDVWSFSVLLWELFSLGGIPYAGLCAAELKINISSKNFLEKPKGCPKTVYDIMVSSWVNESGKRPTFDAIEKTLQKSLTDFNYLEKNNKSKEPFYHSLDPFLD